MVKLREEGYNVGRKTVRRLMQKMAIYAIYPKINLSKRNFKESIVPYLLRNYPINFPNQVWSIDIILNDKIFFTFYIKSVTLCLEVKQI